MAPEVIVPDPTDPNDPLATPAAWDAFVAFYPVADLAATRDFYERELGLELARDQTHERGGCLIFRAAGRGFVGFCTGDAPAPRHPGVILTFVTDDVERVYRRFLAHGVETEGPPRDHPEYAITHVFAVDPDGYRVEVQRFHQPLG